MGALDGKVAVITGAGRGIGRGEALLFATEGARVVVNDLGGAWDGTGADPRAASQVVEEIRGAGGEAVAHFDDISEPSGAESLLNLALATWGRLDVAVNNAGILRDRMVFNMEAEDWDAVMKVHLRGHFLVTKAACAHWRSLAKAGQAAGGRIVNTSSTSGLLGNIGQSNYGVAKAGIAAFSCIVAMEMQRYGVTVNAIAPGARTRMTEKTFGDLSVTEGQFDSLAPENVAPLVVYLASDAAAHITGQVFYVQGGIVQLYRGWGPVSEVRKDERWTPSELAERMGELFGDQPTTYAPDRSPPPADGQDRAAVRIAPRVARGLRATSFSRSALFDRRKMRLPFRSDLSAGSRPDASAQVRACHTPRLEFGPRRETSCPMHGTKGAGWGSPSPQWRLWSWRAWSGSR
jgi:NAD(P)-dependent dehydrogenase (short-subunit alcohol dehydrogenase family)